MLYSVELFEGYDLQIAMGNVSYEHIEKNILYYPVYLINIIILIVKNKLCIQK